MYDFNNVILLDNAFKPIGLCEKMTAHKEHLLHRAFSVFVHNGRGQLLLQKRNTDKYHSGGLWSNTCCSHPMTDDIIAEANVRLMQEMGIQCPLEELFTFHYQAYFDNGISENEYDHVLAGCFDGLPTPDPGEAHDYMWVDFDRLIEEINTRPKNFTVWFKHSIYTVLEHLNRSFSEEHLISVDSKLK